MEYLESLWRGIWNTSNSLIIVSWTGDKAVRTSNHNFQNLVNTLMGVVDSEIGKLSLIETHWSCFTFRCCFKYSFAFWFLSIKYINYMYDSTALGFKYYLLTTLVAFIYLHDTQSLGPVQKQRAANRYGEWWWKWISKQRLAESWWQCNKCKHDECIWPVLHDMKKEETLETWKGVLCFHFLSVGLYAGYITHIWTKKTIFWWIQQSLGHEFLGCFW